MARPGVQRSTSSTSTLSCITVTDKALSATPVGSVSTPPTSVTDAASIYSREIKRNQKADGENRSVQRVRTSVTSYNENTLSGSARRSSQRQSNNETFDNVSGNTLVTKGQDARRQPVQDSIHLRNPDCKVDVVPGNGIKGLITTTEKLKRRKSTRLDLFDRTSSAIEGTRSVLGKRGRKIVEGGKENFHDLSKRASLRPKDQETPSASEPAKKRLKIAEIAREEQPTSPVELNYKSTSQPRVKRWLSQGLYVGQDPDFDPRLTEAKNKLKRASTGKAVARERCFMPMPMFAGRITLERGHDFRLPFNVFSPLPPGQPKPEEWRKTQKNVFVGDAADIWKHSKRLEHSTCVCTTDSGCDENCFNRFMFYECDDNNCSIDASHCTNRSFENLRKRCKAGGKYNIGVEVIKTEDRGYGVRSNRTFEPNQIIVEYTGEIITQDECDNRMRKDYKDNKCFYLMVFDQNMIIDATRGSIARFVNHSCEPNCKMIKWTVAGKPRMALFAGENGIMTGEELTYDYNFDPFSSKNIQQCRCGALTCRGVLGPKPKEQSSGKTKDVANILKPLVQRSMKRKLQDTVQGSLSAMANKKRKSATLSTIKAVVNTVKRRASTQLNQAKSLVSSSEANSNLVKRVSERSLKRSRKAQVVGEETATRRHSSEEILSRRRTGQDLRPPSRGTGVKMAAVSIRRNVVRTVKGSNRSMAVEKLSRL